MSFEKLLDELETMSKALPAEDGDEKIAAAAGGDDDEDEKKKAEKTLDLDKDADNCGDDEGKMTKSFVLKLEDGTEVEAQDGTEMVKALTARVEAAEAGLAAEGPLHKALETAVGMLKSQGEMIKSLQAKVTELAGAGRGRKTVVTVAEKHAPGASTMAKSETPSMSGKEFMAKALEAQKAGRLTALDVAIAEGHLNRGSAVPEAIVARVVGQ